MALALFLLVAILAVALVVRAGWPSDPHARPEAAVRAYIAAAKRRDVGGMRALAIAPERLQRALACQPSDRRVTLVEAVASARESMHERATITVRLMSIVEVSRRNVAIGDDYNGGRATEPFELRRLRMDVLADNGYSREERFEEVDAILLDGRWWLVIPTP